MSEKKQDRLVYKWNTYKLYKCLACDLEQDTGIPCDRLELHDDGGYLYHEEVYKKGELYTIAQLADHNKKLEKELEEIRKKVLAWTSRIYDNNQTWEKRKKFNTVLNYSDLDELRKAVEVKDE